jgi:hypothetical protein
MHMFLLYKTNRYENYFNMAGSAIFKVAGYPGNPAPVYTDYR